MGQRVADLAAVVEAGAADHPVRHAEPDELLLDGPALRVGAVEDRHLGPAVPAAVVEAGEAAGDPTGLVVLVVGPVADDALSTAGGGPEFLGRPALVPRDDGVGGIEDGLRGAVVLVEDDDGGIGEGLLELEDVADVGAAELVDRLVAVTDHADVAVLLAEQQHELVLDGVGVLVLVDEHVLESAPVVGEHLRVLAQQAHGVAEQVVEVHGPCPLQALLVQREHLGQACLVRSGRPVGVLRGGEPLVLGRRERRLDSAGREPLGVEP